MKQIVTLFLALFIHCTVSGQTFEWVRGGGSTAAMGIGAYSVEATYKMCTDPHGNIYALSVVGNAPVTADTFSHIATGPLNVLFTSHNCYGQMRFAKLISCTIAAQQGIVADSFGNLYLAMDLVHGSSGTDILRIGYDTTIATFTNSQQALIKYDTSGDLKWIRFVGNNTPLSFSGTSGDYNHVVLDGAQNPHLIINNRAGIVFRPGDTSKYGATDLRYDPAGNLLSVKHLDLDTTLLVKGVVIDPTSNKLYGYGEKSYTFVPFPQHKFLAAFDTNRNLIWSDTLNNPGSISYGFTGINADGYGHLYFSAVGSYGMTIFKTDTAINTLSSTGCLSLLMKADTAGNVKWQTTFSANLSSQLYNLVLSPDRRKLALTGTLENKIKCGVDSITSYAGEADNPSLAILDTAGYVHELRQLHAPGFNTWTNISAFDRVGNFYLGGRMVSSVWGGSETPYASVGGDTDFFIMKYGVDCNCPAMPVADFTAVQTGTHTYNFTYTGTPGDSVRWYFGDGTTSTVVNPIHTFVASGKLTVRCRVYTTCGRDLKAIKLNLPCTYPGGASFTYSGASAIAFNYTGSTTDVDSIRWSFGDGGTSPLTNPTHTYASIGSYNVCVKVYSWCGVDSFCTTITVPCISAPSVTFLSTGTGPSRSFNYTGTLTGVTSISWDYGDGSGTGSGASTSHTYGAVGIYTVCVTATNPCGSNVICATVNVTCLSTPTASFAKAGSMATHSFGFVGSPIGLDSVTWSFGDGGHATSMSPSHTYVATGVFTVCVTAHSQCGNAVWCDTVDIHCLAIPSVTFTNTGGIHDSTKVFTYTGSSMGIDSLRWNFGDGKGFTGTTATHSYSDTGSYTVCAIAYSQCGNDTTCSTVIYRSSVGVASVFSDNVRVYPNPANGQLMIENADGYTIRITDVVDREVYGGTVSGSKQTLNISSFAAGVYIVQLTNNSGGKMAVKLIKQ